jgi:hypothetical protein
VVVPWSAMLIGWHYCKRYRGARQHFYVQQQTIERREQRTHF